MFTYSYSVYVPLCVLCFIVLFCVLLVFKCVLCCCHRLSTKMSLQKLSITLGINFSFFEVTFHVYNFRNFYTFWTTNIGTVHWAVCDASNCNTNFTKDFNNENLTLKH